MHRQWLQQKLAEYQPIDEQDQATLKLFQDFVAQHPQCFDRDFCHIGHITGSAWIISTNRQKAVLLNHRKLQKWLQPGGHSDSQPNTLEVALREAQEETGLKSLTPLSENIFDLALFTNKLLSTDRPNHTHYDVRFIFQANQQETLKNDKDSEDIRWIHLNEIPNYNNQEDILRLIRKTKTILF